MFWIYQEFFITKLSTWFVGSDFDPRHQYIVLYELIAVINSLTPGRYGVIFRVYFLNKFYEMVSWALLKLVSRECHYRKTSNISRIFVSNIIVDNSYVVGSSPVGAAPTTSSLST